MYYGNIKNCDIANGEGVRVTLFVSGCTNRCEHCFQPETWDFCYGEEFTREVEDKIIAMLAPEHISGLTVLGGEPFEPKNQEVILNFLYRVKEKYPDKTIWIFSGFTYEELTAKCSYPRTEYTEAILNIADVLVDGRYEHDKRNLSLQFRGSTNQRIIDLNSTRQTKMLTFWNK